MIWANFVGTQMDLGELYFRFEAEFEVDFPENAEETMVHVRDVRDYVRRMYLHQGIEAPSGAIFERVRRLTAVFARADATEIRPETRFSDIVRRSHAA